MRRMLSMTLIPSLLLALAHGSGTDAKASHSKGRSARSTRSAHSRTVTVTKFHATLAAAGTQTSASGYAENVTVSIAKPSTNTTTTNSHLIVHVKHLTLANSTEVTFELNGTSIGTGTVKSGRALLHLSTVKGETVPTVTAKDTLTVVETVGATTALTGEFGAATTETR